MQSAAYADPIDWEDRALGPLLPRRQTTAWRAVIKAIYGSPLTHDELVIYRRLSGGVDPPAGGHSRVLIVAGRRAGKTDAAGLITAYEATQVPHDLYLGPRQVGVAAVLAQDLDRADEGINACRSYLTAEDPPSKGKRKPAQRYVEKDQVESVLLKNGIEIKKLTATEKGVRGPTCVCVIGDEVAAWDKSGPSEDERIMGALLPSLTIESDAPPRRMIAITSAGSKKGWAWRIFKEHYGKTDQPWLVLSGATYDLRPTIEEKRADHIAECAGRSGQFEREYLSQWGEDGGETFFQGSIVKPCVNATCPYVVPPGTDPPAGVRYFIACDPAYERDRFAIAVACSTNEIDPNDVQQKRHRRTSLVHIETLRRTKDRKLSAEDAAARLAVLCARYGVRTVYSDQHDPEALRGALKRYGIRLVVRPWHSSPKPSDPKVKDRNPSKFERFSAVREAMISEALTLPDAPELLQELSEIEAKELDNGGVRIEGGGKHDDRAHAAILAISEALMSPPSIAENSLTSWERNQRDTSMHRVVLALYGCG